MEYGHVVLLEPRGGWFGRVKGSTQGHRGRRLAKSDPRNLQPLLWSSKKLRWNRISFLSVSLPDSKYQLLYNMHIYCMYIYIYTYIYIYSLIFPPWNSKYCYHTCLWLKISYLLFFLFCFLPNCTNKTLTLTAGRLCCLFLLTVRNRFCVWFHLFTSTLCDLWPSCCSESLKPGVVCLGFDIQFHGIISISLKTSHSW